MAGDVQLCHSLKQALLIMHEARGEMEPSQTCQVSDVKVPTVMRHRVGPVGLQPAHIYSPHLPHLHISYFWALATMSTPACALFCLGQPLLDMQVTNGEELLKKYNLKANDGILAGPQHIDMYVRLCSWESPSRH